MSGVASRHSLLRKTRKFSWGNGSGWPSRTTVWVIVCVSGNIATSSVSNDATEAVVGIARSRLVFGVDNGLEVLGRVELAGSPLD
jgi:hypothetical protein